MLRLALARTLAWALLMAGWFGLTQLAERHAAGPLPAFVLVAGWLLALGVAASAVARLAAPAWLWRALLLAGALIAARGLFGLTQGGGMVQLWPVMLAWALLVALASGTVRALRHAVPRRAAAPVLPAAAGATLAALAVGDAADPLRLAAVLAVIAGVLACLAPAGGTRAARPGCRAGLFDCALPAWPREAWQEPSRWPLLIATLAMLPMMAALPQMLALCSAEGLSPPALLAAHLLAMFGPALLWQRRWPARWRAPACALLLVLGGSMAWWQPAQAPLWAMLMQGAAWSLAWSAQLGDAGARAAPRSAPWRGALGHALFALALGVAVAFAGPRALHAVQVLLALAAALSVVAWAAVPSFRVRSRCP